MKEPAIGVHQAIIPNGQSPEVTQPTNRPLYDPAASVPAQSASILVGDSLVVYPSQNNRLNPTPDKQGPGGIAVIGPVNNQSVRSLPRASWLMRPRYRNRVERRGEGLTSAGDADSRYAPSGVPAPSTNTIHFVPLPRLVGPTLVPPFSLARRSHP